MTDEPMNLKTATGQNVPLSDGLGTAKTGKTKLPTDDWLEYFTVRFDENERAKSLGLPCFASAPETRREAAYKLPTIRHALFRHLFRLLNALCFHGKVAVHLLKDGTQCFLLTTCQLAHGQKQFVFSIIRFLCPRVMPNAKVRGVLPVNNDKGRQK